MALTIFLLLEHFYILSYHPSNLASSKMSEILTNAQLEKKLLTIEKKITRYNHHKEFLQNNEVNRKYPKGLALKSNFSWCSDWPNLQKACWSILRNASFQLRVILSKVISFIRKESYNILSEKNSSKQLEEIYKAIKKEKGSLSSTILKRQQSKYQRDIIAIFNHPWKNRRFRKSKWRHHNNQRKLLYRENGRKITEVAKTTCPDQKRL